MKQERVRQFSLMRWWRWRWVRLGCAASLAALAGVAGAQAISPSELPKVLKELPRAGAMCKRDSAEDVGPPLSGGVARDADLGCLLSPGEVQARWTPATSALFDLRSRSRYERFHLEGAVSSSEAELLSKPYWKEKHVVLVGEGRDDARLAMVCGRLKQAGYRNVMVMQGGMLGAVRDGRTVLGMPERLGAMAQIGTEELWYLMRQPTTLALADGERGEFLKVKEFRLVRPLPDLNEAGLAKALEASVSGKGASRPSIKAVVLLSGRLDDDSLTVLSKAVAPAPLLVYSETYESYLREMNKQAAMWKAQERGPKKTPCLG
ncbi:rhodanese-like domain-containing protein [Hydrogenophaga flava]|uniref:rhodanese-like domain-containing protein n=1 Tax=Hydrogenophaga flava TaxID=65657 RepID=UPI0008250782|nr:rhodanese-like domain-containing protein [Hydrogenophaga flava]